MIEIVLIWLFAYMTNELLKSFKNENSKRED